MRLTLSANTYAIRHRPAAHRRLHLGLVERSELGNYGINSGHARSCVLALLERQHDRLVHPAGSGRTRKPRARASVAVAHLGDRLLSTRLRHLVATWLVARVHGVSGQQRLPSWSRLHPGSSEIHAQTLDRRPPITCWSGGALIIHLECCVVNHYV